MAMTSRLDDGAQAARLVMPQDDACDLVVQVAADEIEEVPTVAGRLGPRVMRPQT
ncbi:hypothetical protein [Cellulosimicrobium sp. Marseille-Q8652]